MHNLHNKVLGYYLQNLQRLSPGKQFHFASRLYLWNQQTGMRQQLDRLRPWFTANERPYNALQKLIQESKDNPDYGSKGTLDLRRPFYKRYPELTIYLPLLARITFLKTIYGIDCRNRFSQLFSETGTEQTVAQLLGDTAAISILSSQAVNFLYLYQRVIKKDNTTLTPSTFLSLGQHAYNHKNKLHIQLLLYLYTHCIIAETQYYYRRLPTAYLETYKSMVVELEEIIRLHFKDIKLDNKLEFLVCCRMTQYHTALANKIHDECRDSISAEGNFIVDTHNIYSSDMRLKTYAASEHRNVLFIMSEVPCQAALLPGQVSQITG